MIRTDLREALKFTGGKIDESLREKAASALGQVRNGTGRGSEWLGWRRVASRPDPEELGRIRRIAAGPREKADVFVVCGIGGSYLGARALIEALCDPWQTDGPEILFAGHHMGGSRLRQLIRYLERPAPDGRRKSVWLNVISKSGTTLETALAFRELRTWMERTWGDEASERIIATTGPSGGVLNDMIAESGYEKLVIPDDVGGRYSVLTPVGLLPVAVAGIDIGRLLEGASDAFHRYERDGGDLIDLAALRYLFHEQGKTLEVIGSFEPELQAFSGWIQQLLGESEGKEGKGLFPVPAAFSADLHSVGQMIQQGRRNLVETLLVVDRSEDGMKVSRGGGDTDGLAWLEGRTFHDINRQALDGTVEAHSEGGVPVLQIVLETLDARHLGELIYFYELLTAVSGYLLGVNPFDQPGVEDYKKAMYRNLGK